VAQLEAADDHMSDPMRPDEERTVLLVTRDLMARERIRSAAAHLSMAVRYAAPHELHEMLGAAQPDVLVLDLDEGREDLLADVGSARSEGLVPPVVLGYFSHVDSGLGEAAERAGVTAVRRGRFWSALGQYLAPD
jgi:AmiR/NasT family two-component response regulator